MRFGSIVLSALLAFVPISLSAQDGSDDVLPEIKLLPEILQSNPNAAIFYSALEATGLRDTLGKYLDETYPGIEYDWTVQALKDNYFGIHQHQTRYETDYIAMPDKREFKFTLFLMPDTALANYSDSYWTGGIHNLSELRQYAEKVYPEGAGQADNLRTSSLNKLISYHILPSWMPYDQLNTSQTGIIQRRLYLTEHDVEDFFETLLPHSVMRISTPYATNYYNSPLGIYINRKGTETTGLVTEGIRIAKDASEYNLPENVTNTCTNGGYHYINKLLVYDKFTRETALNTRMRIMACTLSPDFINSGGRGRLRGDPAYGGNRYLDRLVMTYMPGYCKNVSWTESTRFFVRYRDRAFGTYYGDEMTLRGCYDITFRLPPVPADGLYEIRIWNNSMGGSYYDDRGKALYYVGNDMQNLVPCGTPVNMRIALDDPTLGGVRDEDYDYLNDSERAVAIDANDKVLHQKGYMKAPDSYTNSMSSDNSGTPIRNDLNCYRRIICELYMEADKDYHLRLRQMEQDDAIFAFSFIEIVPYSVYSGENGPEDKH